MLWNVRDRGDTECRIIADRHYNRQKPGTAQFVPPGRCLVLLADTASGQALWITSWPFAEYVKHAWPGAWVCSAFRNEGAALASELIRQATAATRYTFGDPPELGMITFVRPDKVRKKRDPGRCFLRAGFKNVGTTKKGYVALQLLPDAMPEAEAPYGLL